MPSPNVATTRASSPLPAGGDSAKRNSSRQSPRFCTDRLENWLTPAELAWLKDLASRERREYMRHSPSLGRRLVAGSEAWERTHWAMVPGHLPLLRRLGPKTMKVAQQRFHPDRHGDEVLPVFQLLGAEKARRKKHVLAG